MLLEQKRKCYFASFEGSPVYDTEKEAVVEKVNHHDSIKNELKPQLGANNDKDLEPKKIMARILILSLKIWI